MKIELSENEKQLVYEFIEKQKEKDYSDISNSRWVYMIIPGAIGSRLIIKDELLGEIKDITDYTVW